MDIAGLATLAGQLGFAIAAWKLANALKLRVDNHESRITVIERAQEHCPVIQARAVHTNGVR